MKLFVTINKEPINTYITVDPFGGSNKIAIDHRNLDQACSTNECMEIYAPEILDHVHFTELDNFIKHYISKLRHGGRLIIGGTDIRDIAKKIIKDELSINDVNNLFFGMSPMNWLSKTGSYTMHDIVNLLKQNGLKIVKQKCDDIKYIIEAKRD